MTYPILSAKNAETFLEGIQSGGQSSIDDFVSYRESESSFAYADAVALRKKLMDLKGGFPVEIGPKSKHASEFEASASALVHEHIGDAQYSADPEFWTWLTCAHFSDLVVWRYGISCAPANYGIGAPGENFLFRLWLRAELVRDTSLEDSYRLARTKSSVDFWRSHLFRQSYANSRAFARALFKFQYPSSDNKPRLKRDEIRELAKRLARMKSNLLVAYLEEGEALRLIEAEAKILAAAA